MVQLTTEQREAITHGAPVEVSDGARSYYLITQQQYDQLRSLLDGLEFKKRRIDFFRVE